MNLQCVKNVSSWYMCFESDKIKFLIYILFFDKLLGHKTKSTQKWSKRKIKRGNFEIPSLVHHFSENRKIDRLY